MILPQCFQISSWCSRSWSDFHKRSLTGMKRGRPFRSKLIGETWRTFLRSCCEVVGDCNQELLASFGSFRRLLILFLQRLFNSLPVANVAEKVSSPRNEILSSALLYVRITNLTLSTLCLRVGFHIDSSSLSGPSSSRTLFNGRGNENYW